MIIVQTIISRWNDSPGPEALMLPEQLLDMPGPLVAHKVEFVEGRYNEPFVTIRSGELNSLPPYRFGEAAHGMLVYYGENNPWWPELSESVPFLTLQRGQVARLEHKRPSAWNQMRHWRQIDNIICTDAPRPRLLLDKSPKIHKVAVMD